MHPHHAAVIRVSILFGFGFLPFQTVTSDEIVRKSVTSSPAAALSWPSNIENKSVSLPTQRDIINAFSIVTNDSNQIKQTISRMYNLHLANPAYVFRLPQGGGAKSRFLKIQKSDLVQPIFPNLSNSYIRLMKSKGKAGKDYNRDAENHWRPTKADFDWWNRVNSNSVEDDDPVLNLQTERNFIEYVNELNKKDKEVLDKEEGSNDEWSLLGLHGWKGVLSKPKQSSRSLLNGDAKPNEKKSEKPAQMWDLPGKMQEDSLELDIVQSMRNTSILNVIGNFSGSTTYPITNMHNEHSNKDVYIARVNDPFGHSTKWNVKNSSANTPQEDRKKRAVIELYSMIKCSTGCDPIVYKGYGCYCGFLGDGQPVDGIDRCCRLHDKCYENSNCITYLEYFVPYIWKCYRGKPLCAIDHGEWGEPSSCAARLCQCDMLLSRCLRQFVCPQRRGICRTSRARMLQNFLFNF